MGSEVNVVVAETFRGNDSTVDTHGFNGLTETTRNIEFIGVSLRRADEKNTDEVDFFIAHSCVYKRFSPIMTGHFLRSGPDASQSMNCAVNEFERIEHYRKVTEVNVRFCTQRADRFNRENQVIMHCALTHDFFNNDDTGFARTTILYDFFFFYYEGIVSLLNGFTNFLSNVVGSTVCSQGARTFHVGFSSDGNVRLNEDFALIGSTRTTPHDVLIHFAFGRTEFADLNAVFIRTGYDEYNAVQDTGDAFAEVAFHLRCQRLYVHDRVGNFTVTSGSNDIEGQVFYEFLSIHSFLANAVFTDIQGRTFDFCFFAEFYLFDFQVVVTKFANFNFFLSCRFSNGSCYGSTCYGSRNSCTAYAEGKLEVDIFAFTDVNANGTADSSNRSACNGSCNRSRFSNRSCVSGSFFSSRSCFSHSRHAVEHVRSQSNERIGRYFQSSTDNFADMSYIVGDSQQAGINQIRENVGVL